MVVILLANVHSFTDWLILYCCRQQSKQETGDSSTTQISPSTNPDALVYADIRQNRDAINTSQNDDDYVNVAPKNNLVYLELQRRDNT